MAALAAVAVGAWVLSACSPGDLGTSNGGEAVTLSFLVDNSDPTVKTAQGLVDAFSAKNPNIKISVETRPQGSDGDNIVKTRLATGDMTDMFWYNSGSLFQALKPEQNLAPVSDLPNVGDIDASFKTTVSAGGQLYGVPAGQATGGGILYNKAIYSRLSLQVPKTWAEFMANNAKIKAAGIAPVIQSYQDSWTSQLFVLADFHNVSAAQPDWAQKYTANQAKYATTPAATQGFQHLQDVHDAGYLNDDFASLKFEQALKALADGKGAHYPMLTFAVGTIASQSPDKIGDIGFFAQPGDDAGKNGLCSEVDDRREAGRREEVPGVRGEQGRLRRAGEGVHPERTLPGEGLHPAVRRAGRHQGHAAVLRQGQQQPGAGVPLTDQGSGPRADHRRGGFRHPQGRVGRRTLRPGREEAGAAARSAGLVGQRW
jgi:raffinose/stachyose/melibiose transport system substrate-binding protein